MKTSPVSFPISLPAPAGACEPPVWTGKAFRIGSRELSILSYEVGASGWTDELTYFHESTAGADHYIDRASRRHTLNTLRRWLPISAPVIMDVGCSSGLMLQLLQDEFPAATVVGADYVRGPLEALARTQPAVPLLQFDLTRCPLPDQSFDGIVLLNVLEHIEHDEVALTHVARILKPNGIAVIEVPASPGLYDVYDKLLCHHRRYTMKALSDRVSAAGLRIVEKSHLGFFLFPAFWAIKKRGRRHLGASSDIQKEIVSRNITTASSHPLMHRVMELEDGLRKWLYYPFGIRCLLTCQRMA